MLSKKRTMEEEIVSYTYDGDIAPGIRQKARKTECIILTSPDMLHSGIPPHPTKLLHWMLSIPYKKLSYGIIKARMYRMEGRCVNGHKT